MDLLLFYAATRPTEDGICSCFHGIIRLTDLMLVDRRPTWSDFVYAGAMKVHLTNALAKNILQTKPSHIQVLKAGFSVDDVCDLIRTGRVYELSEDEIRHTVVARLIRIKKHQLVWKPIAAMQEQECCICLQDSTDLLSVCPSGHTGHAMCEECVSILYTGFYMQWRMPPAKVCPCCRRDLIP